MKKTTTFLAFLFLTILVNAQSYDMAMVEISTPAMVNITDAPFVLSGEISNLGSETINSFDLNLSIDGAPPKVFSFSGLSIAPFFNYTFTRLNAWEVFVPGRRYTLTIWASNLNGNADENTVNDSLSKFVEVVDEFVERNAFHEVFTSSTCGPCAPGNVNTDAVWAASFETPVILKYQMSWPGTGDPYYTLEGNARRTYYSVNSVPNMQIDGDWNGNSNSYTSTILNEFSAIPAFLEIEGNYTVTGQTVDINLALKPLKDIKGNNRLHIAIIEKTTFNNIKTNGETVFHDVMKKMVPNANGTGVGNILAGVPLTYNFSYTFQGNYRLPGNAQSPINHATEHSVEEFSDLGVVVWVQNQGSKDVFHSAYSLDKSTNTDLAIKKVNLPELVEVNSNVAVEGVVVNNQLTTINSFDVVFTINGGFPFRQNFSGLSLNSGDTLVFTHSQQWQPSNTGYHKIAVTVDNINGAGVNTTDDLELNNSSFNYVTVVDMLSGIPIHEAVKTISVYPNPSEGMVYINSETSIAKSVEVYTLMGHRVNTIELGSKGIFNLDMSTMAAGVYILKFQTANGSFSQRLVIE